MILGVQQWALVGDESAASLLDALIDPVKYM